MRHVCRYLGQGSSVLLVVLAGLVLFLDAGPSLFRSELPLQGHGFCGVPGLSHSIGARRGLTLMMRGGVRDLIWTDGKVNNLYLPDAHFVGVDDSGRVILTRRSDAARGRDIKEIMLADGRLAALIPEGDNERVEVTGVGKLLTVASLVSATTVLLDGSPPRPVREIAGVWQVAPVIGSDDEAWVHIRSDADSSPHRLEHRAGSHLERILFSVPLPLGGLWHVLALDPARGLLLAVWDPGKPLPWQQTIGRVYRVSQTGLEQVVEGRLTHAIGYLTWLPESVIDCDRLRKLVRSLEERAIHGHGHVDGRDSGASSTGE
jgi:hypothetical protein